MLFREWIDKESGVRAFARKMGVSHTVVSNWYHLKRFPRPLNQEKIRHKTNNQIDFDLWRVAYLHKQQALQKEQHGSHSIDGTKSGSSALCR